MLPLTSSIECIGVLKYFFLTRWLLYIKHFCWQMQKYNAACLCLRVTAMSLMAINLSVLLYSFPLLARFRLSSLNLVHRVLKAYSLRFHLLGLLLQLITVTLDMCLNRCVNRLSSIVILVIVSTRGLEFYSFWIVSFFIKPAWHC